MLHILALRHTGYGDMGGYLAQFGPLLPTGNQVKNIASIYRTPLMEVATQMRLHQHEFRLAYRGAGRPEGNYYVDACSILPPPKWASTASSCASAT